MNKKILIVIVVFLLALLGLILFGPKVEFKGDVSYERHSDVYNQTDKPYIDDILHVGLNYLNIKSVIVIVKEIDKNLSIDGQYDAKASLRTNNYQYLISLHDMKKREAIMTLAHELIHLHQYYVNDLYVGVRGEEDIIFYKNQVFPVNTLNQIPYMERPWEIDAFERQKELIEILEKELLK